MYPISPFSPPVVVVLDLHDLVAGGESPAEPLDLAFVGGIV